LASFLAIKIEIEFHAHRSGDEVAVELSILASIIYWCFDDSKTIARPYLRCKMNVNTFDNEKSAYRDFGDADRCAESVKVLPKVVGFIRVRTPVPTQREC
jgi:hypothetical protein